MNYKYEYAQLNGLIIMQEPSESTNMGLSSATQIQNNSASAGSCDFCKCK